MTKAFKEGFLSIFSLNIQKPKHFYKPLTNEEAMQKDAEDIAKDWNTIGQDLWSVIEKHKYTRKTF